MSNTNSVFKKVPAKVQRLNGFDQSHMNLFTGKIGTLIPVLVDRLMPGDKVSLGTTFRVCMPPMATDFLGKVTANVRAFFVPERLIFGGWKEYMMYSGGLADQFQPAGLSRTYLPSIKVTTATTLTAPGSLLDYLGLKNPAGAAVSGVECDSAIAYHLIWADWYRDPRIQVDPFLHGQTGSGVKYVRGSRYTAVTEFVDAANDLDLADSVSVLSLRQVNYEKDYFTTAFTDQYGGATPMSVAVAPFVLPANTGAGGRYILQNNGTGGNDLYSYASGTTDAPLTQIGTFTIPQVRVANQLERFAEKMALSGGVYQDAILAEYGVRPADGLVDRSIYLGSLTASVYNNTVYASNSTGSPDSNAENPFAGQQGASSASSKAIGSGSFVNFVAKEHGIFMVLMDVQPHAIYSTGSRRYLFSEGDGFVDKFCVPSLAGIGHQPIYQSELVGGAPNRANIFGFTDRYADLKWHLDEVHGLLRAGGNLEAFALQRNFTGATPTISSSFVQVDTTDMDNVTAVSSELSNYGYWCDMYHSYKLVRPLPAYSIPSLEGLEDKKTVMVDRNGRRF